MNDESLKEIIEVYQRKTFDLFNKNVALEAQVSYLQKQLANLHQENNSSDQF